MNINKVQSGRCSPVAEESGFYVFGQQRMAQQRIVHQVDLAHRNIVGSSPVAVHQFDLGGQLLLHGCCPDLAAISMLVWQLMALPS